MLTRIPEARLSGAAIGAVAGFLVLSAVACGNTTAPPTEAQVGLTTLADASEDGLAAAPDTDSQVVLITGAISNSNSPRGVALDLVGLERFRIVEASIFEPFLEEQTTFSGVSMPDLLAAVGPSSDATEVVVSALDDYAWTFSLEDLQDGGALLATHEKGQPIPTEAGGPIRLIFTSEAEAGSDTDSWVWSVNRIEVR